MPIWPRLGSKPKNSRKVFETTDNAVKATSSKSQYKRRKDKKQQAKAKEKDDAKANLKQNAGAVEKTMRKDISKIAWQRRKEGQDAKSPGVWINFTTARLGETPNP